MRVAVKEGMTQNEIIMKHLRQNPRGITPLEAMNYYSIMRLGARIWELKADGHLIDTETVERKRGSKKVRYARYVLKGA